MYFLIKKKYKLSLLFFREQWSDHPTETEVYTAELKYIVLSIGNESDCLYESTDCIWINLIQSSMISSTTCISFLAGM